MNIRTFLIIVAVAVLLIIGYFAYSSGGEDVAPAEIETATTTETGVLTPGNLAPSADGNTGGTAVTISYDGNAFSPANVSVPVGTTVTWTNTSSGRMWIGSDDHPTHTHYDGTSTAQHCANGAPTSASVFDQCSAGARYSFTFTKAGTWAYHNHANARAGGTVVVTE